MLEYFGFFFSFLINNEDTDIFFVWVGVGEGGCVLVKLIDHLHETASHDELRYVITEGEGSSQYSHCSQWRERGGEQ